MKTFTSLTMLIASALIASNVALAFDTATSPLKSPAANQCLTPPANSVIYSTQQQVKWISSDHPIAYYQFGQGSPIVLVTGYRATISEWNAKFLAELAKHHEVIVFDNRGVGKSKPDATSFSIEEMAQDTAQLISALDLHHPVVLGWSMGGEIVQQLAIDNPGIASGIVLMNTIAPGSYGLPPSAELMAKLSGAPGVTFNDIMAALFPESSLTYAEACFVSEMYTPSDYGKPGISAVVTAGQATALNNWSSRENNRIAAELKQLEVPALIVSGDHDEIAAERNANSLHKLLPHQKDYRVSDGGHAMMYQFPEMLAGEISAFANRVAP